MAKKKNKKVEIENKPTPLTEEQKQQTARMIGFVAGLFSKFMLKAGGCEVDFKINGAGFVSGFALQKVQF